jgi:6-phosphogluconolactonase
MPRKKKPSKRHIRKSRRTARGTAKRKVRGPALGFSPEVHIAPDANALNHDVADLFVRAAREAVEKRGRFMVALSGGDGPVGLYRLLATEPYLSDTPWDRTNVFWGDDRHVPLDHPDSNYKLCLDLLLSRAKVPPARLFPMTDGVMPPARAAAEYEKTLRRLFGGKGFPALDFNLMGLGPDGHTASLFPNRPQLREKRRWVVGYHVDAERRDRVTLTFPVLNAARLTVVLVPGNRKARILKDVLEGALAPDRHPVQRLKAAPGGRLLFALDGPAAVLLDSKTERLGED